MTHIKDTDPSLHQEVQQFLKGWQPLGWAGLDLYIKHWAVSNMYDRDVMRLEISFHDNAVLPPGVTPANNRDPAWLARLIVQDIASQPKVERLPGMAPKGDIAQKIQKWLDSQEAA